jgi:hypothetical protein
MKRVTSIVGSFLLVVVAVASCGPSPSTIAATAVAAIQQTQTAAPTTTPVPSNTPDLSAAGTAIAAMTATGGAEQTSTAFANLPLPSATTIASATPSATATLPTATASPTPTTTSTETPTHRPVVSPAATPTFVPTPGATLGAGSFTFSGFVINYQTPVSGATVTLRAASGAELTAVTDAGGNFIIANVPNGRWGYTAQAQGMVAADFSGDQTSYTDDKGWHTCTGSDSCGFQADTGGSTKATIYMARTDVIQWKPSTRDATNIATVGDIGWEAVPGAVEYHLTVFGQFLDGSNEFTNTDIHQTFVVTKDAFVKNTVVGQCYTIKLIADGNPTGTQTIPIGLSVLRLCRY